MALSNFSLPFTGGIPTHNWAETVNPIQQIQSNSNTNNLLYGPDGHQQSDIIQTNYYKNNPYLPPLSPQPFQYNNNNNGNNNRKGGQTYLPPPPPVNRNPLHQRTYDQQSFSQAAGVSYQPAIVSQQPPSSMTYNDNGYSSFPSAPTSQSAPQAPRIQKHYYTSSYNAQSHTSYAAGVTASSLQESGNDRFGGVSDQKPERREQGPPVVQSVEQESVQENMATSTGKTNEENPFPERPQGFTKVQAGQGSRTQVHAVLDYDLEEGEEEDYYDAENSGLPAGRDGDKTTMPTVTPIQGPIFLKNGTVPVVPLFSYPTVNNGSFVQIPIWWTALSVALGLDIRGDVIKGVPCIKRYHQLFCPTAGNSYPIDKIEKFIDDNKALMRRMYGDFQMNMDPGGPKQQPNRRRRFIDEPDLFIPPGGFAATTGSIDEPDKGETYFGHLRNKRQSSSRLPKLPFNKNSNNSGPGNSSTGRVDACESKIEIVTPYWASNSAGKVLAIVNTQHFEQAIHQEICSKTQTKRCEKDCGCEQKYKWHRLLAYDPDNDCKGIFMDWFLFPSCCVCRCNPAT